MSKAALWEKCTPGSTFERCVPALYTFAEDVTALRVEGKTRKEVMRDVLSLYGEMMDTIGDIVSEEFHIWHIRERCQVTEVFVKEHLWGLVNSVMESPGDDSTMISAYWGASYALQTVITK